MDANGPTRITDQALAGNSQMPAKMPAKGQI
jgi:hypothetical protein